MKISKTNKMGFRILAVFEIVLCLSILLPSPNQALSNIQESQILNSQTLNAKLNQLVTSELQNGVEKTNSLGGTVVVQEVDTGKLVAVVNPEDAISQWEPGSVMKSFTMAAALEAQTVTTSSTFMHQDTRTIDGRRITNAISVEQGKHPVDDIITYSINTGAIYLLESLGGNSLDKQARLRWHTFLTQNFDFSQPTCINKKPIGQSGYVHPVDGGDFLHLRYASSSFGISMTTTPIQLSSAYSSLVNGGSLRCASNRTSSSSYLAKRVVKQATSETLVRMLQKNVAVNYPNAVQKGFIVGGKSGTAPASNSLGFYIPNKDNGTFIGFIGRVKPKYMILVKLNQPTTNTFASREAAKVWVRIIKQMAQQPALF